MDLREFLNSRIPGSPGRDSVAATDGMEFDKLAVLLVTTAGTFALKTAVGRTRTNLALPVGIYPVALSELTSITGGGAAEIIYL
jgi:hypothetical protein